MNDPGVGASGQVESAPAAARLTFEVEPAPPFRLDLTVQALRRRASNAIDRFDGTTYRRLLVGERGPFEVRAVQIAPPERPVLEITVRAAGPGPGAKGAALAALTRLLGLERRLDDFYRTATHDPVIGRLALRFRGLKPPRFPTVFEALINAFACQQVTLTLGIQLLNRLAAACARGRDAPDGRVFAFPSPDDLAGRTQDELRALGFSRQKARAMIELAQAVVAGRIDLEGLGDLDDAAVVARLSALRGVGRWSAEYVLLRGLGRLHVFPGDDVGARNNLQRWLGFLEALDYDGVRRVLARWHPFQGLVYLHLLLWALQSEQESRAGPMAGLRPGGRALR
jgi:DNA-3-methyladenine glycosylase II